MAHLITVVFSRKFATSYLKLYSQRLSTNIFVSSIHLVAEMWTFTLTTLLT